jgi:RimJ/RimL family protein N-acetyltransferase
VTSHSGTRQSVTFISTQNFATSDAMPPTIIIVPSGPNADDDRAPQQYESGSDPIFLYEPIRTTRLTLVLLPHSWLAAFLQGTALPHLGFSDPHNVFADANYLIDLRRGQIEQDRTSEPWLLRAVVLTISAEAVGHIGFHGPPDERGMVEIGYTIHSHFRQRGLASEAADGMFRWAGHAGGRVLRASISPDNDASLALVGRAGFVRVGEQHDERDGLELVFERSIHPSNMP